MHRRLATLLLLHSFASADPGVTADALPRVQPTPPADALSTFELRPGFELQLAACEPLVVDPIAIAFDEHNRLFVVEMRGYSERREEALGRVRLLTDTDNDGTFDHASIYADGLKWPTGIACYDGGVFVAASPDIHYFKDTDADGSADTSKIVFTGFGQQRLNVQALLNGFRWSLDNRLYGATAAYGGSIEIPDATPLDLRGRDFSFDPKNLTIRAEPGTAQYGHSFDSFGRRFVCSNSRHIMAVIAPPTGTPPGRYATMPHPLVDIAADGPAAEVFRISPDEPWRVVRTRWRVAGLVGGPVEGGGRPSGYFTGSTGITVYTGDALGPTFADNAFIGDAGSNLVHRKHITYPDGEIQPVASRPGSEHDREFIASTDNWFRPVSFSNGPDGALYIVDMYREIIEHPWSLPPGIKQHLDLNSGNGRGRIYRVVRTATPRRKNSPLADLPTPQLVATLSHPNGWHRNTAQRLLHQRQDPTAIAPLSKLLSDAQSPQARLHAFWSLHGHGALTKPLITTALADPHPALRAAAVTYSRSPLPGDPSPHVRFATAHTLAATTGNIPALAKLLSRPDRRSWIRAATLNAIQSPAAATRLFDLNRSAPVATLLGRTADRNAIATALATPGLSPEVLDALFAGLTTSGSSLAKLGLHPQALPHFNTALQDLTRESNITLLRHAPRALAETPLATQLRTATTHQSALIKTLATIRAGSLPAIIASLWPRLSPGVRSTATAALLSHSPLQALQLVDSATISVSEIPSTNRQSLKRSSDQSIRSLANKLFPTPATDHSARIAARLPDLDLEPDPTKGAAHFALLCASCHQTGTDTPSVGPDRLTFRSSGDASILTNLIDPNREVAPQYLAYNVTLNSGGSQIGLITSESPTHLTLRQPLGVELQLPRSDITSVQALGTSLMPENLDAALSPQALADLIAYLTRG